MNITDEMGNSGEQKTQTHLFCQMQIQVNPLPVLQMKPPPKKQILKTDLQEENTHVTR